MRKRIAWSREKNEWLMSEAGRGVSFEDVLKAVAEGRVLDDLEHPNKERFPHQRILVVEISGYAYTVPYVESNDEIFFKTIFPSRKLTRKYLAKGTSP